MSELRPWQSGESILAAVRGHAPELPDEPPADPSQIRWSAGSRDGVMGRHFGAGDEGTGLVARARRRLSRRADPVARLHSAIVGLARDGGERERLAVYRAAQDPDLLGHIDEALERLLGEPELLPAVAPHARWLASEARHRGPAKLGIALLGVSGGAEDLELVKAFAGHDEFTLYCTVAIQNLVEDPVDALWEFAKAADGWGKIEAVERLAPLVADRPDVKRWLLVDGCANSVMDEYLGHPCATAGELAAALDGDVDDALLDGACTIVSALCIGGPAQDMDDYADGPRAVERLLGHLRTRATTLARAETVLTVRQWLQPEPLPGEDDAAHLREVTETEARRAEQGWTSELRDRLGNACDEILASPDLPDRVRQGFASGDHQQEWLAWRIAPAVGVDLWEDAFAMLERGPLDDAGVFRVISGQDRERQRRVIAWAEGNLPLGGLATGPDHHLFPERDTATANHALTFVVQELAAPELYSEALVAAALRSPVISTRNMALNALESRPRHTWGRAVEEALRRSADDDPHDETRARARETLER